MTPTLHPLAAASRALVHLFGSAQWTQIEGGKWKSAGGRVLSNESYQRAQGKQKSAPAKATKAKAPAKPAAKAAAPKPAAKKPAAAKASPESVKSLYDRAASAHPSEIEGAKDAIAGMSKPELLKAAAAVGHVPRPSDSKAKLAGDLHARIADRHGVALRGKLLHRPESAAGSSTESAKAALAPAPKTDVKTVVAPVVKSATPPATPAAAVPAAGTADKAKVTPGGSVRLKGLRPPGLNSALDAKVQALSILPTPKAAAKASPEADKSHVAAFHTADTKSFGKKAADFLHGALSGLIGHVKSLARPLTRKGGAQVMLRKAARTVLPKVAAGAVGAPLGVGAAAMTALTTAAGHSVGGLPGGVLGAGLGIAGGVSVARNALDTAASAAKGTRLALAKSPAAQRVARRTNKQKLFSEKCDYSEYFADAANAVDPVGLMRARLNAVFARQGLAKPVIHDDVIHNELAKAAAAAAPVAGMKDMAEGCGELAKAAQKAAKFSGLAPFRPNLTHQHGAGLVPFI